MSPPTADPVHVRLPRALLQYWDAPTSVDVEGTSLAACLDEVERRHPGLSQRIRDDQGRVRRHVAVFVNGTMVEVRDPSKVPVRGGDNVHIVPSVSGG